MYKQCRYRQVSAYNANLNCLCDKGSWIPPQRLFNLETPNQLIHRFGFHSKVCGLRTTSLMILHSSKRPCLHLPLMTFRLDSRPYCTDKTWPWERAACAAATSKGPLEAWLGWLVHAHKWRKAHSKGFSNYSARIAFDGHG